MHLWFNFSDSLIGKGLWQLWQFICCWVGSHLKPFLSSLHSWQVKLGASSSRSVEALISEEIKDLDFLPLALGLG